MKRRFFTKADAVLLGVVALLSAGLLALLFRPQSGHLTAEITTDTSVTTVDLETVVEPYTKTITSNGHTLTLSFDRGSVQILESDCPDKCCVACGKLTKNGQCAVCLPAEVIVRVTHQARKVDATV